MGDKKMAEIPKGIAQRHPQSRATGFGSPGGSDSVFASQDHLGNAALARLVGTRVLQRKLIVSDPTDPHEREADLVAERLVSPSPSPPLAISRTSATSVNRECASCAAGLPCENCEDEKDRLIQRQHDHPADDRSHADSEAGHIVSRLGSGQPLDAPLRAQFEPGLGRDLGDVRIHTSSSAGDAARGLHAHAFTVGADIAFAPGRWSPDSHDGRRLLAHELTHVAQQGADRSIVSREPAPPDPGPPINAGLVTVSVDIILKALRGVTTSSDSTKIMQEFEGKSAGWVRAVLSELKSRASQENETTEGMVAWLFGDITAEHRKALRALLLRLQVLDDLRGYLVKEVLGALNLYTSEGESQDVVGTFTQLSPNEADLLLQALEPKAGKNERAMAEALLGGLDRVAAEKLRTHFYNNAGPHAIRYAAHFTTAKIVNLTEGILGFMSHSESTQVVNNFKATPDAYKPLVQEFLDERVARTGATATAESMLMEKLDKEDYEALQNLPGMKLGAYKPKNPDSSLVSGVKWVAMVLQWTTCGMIGIATGLVSAIVDIISGVWDIAKAAYHLVMLTLYALSDGAVGRDSYLAVKEFIEGLTQLSPGKLWDQMWGDLKADFVTIEGPLTDCKRAEFIVRKAVGVIVNILLIFIAGYGLAKTAVSAAEGVAEFANLAQKVGMARALGRTAGRVGRAAVKLVSAGGRSVGKFVEALSKPVETLAKVQKSINVILLAAEDEKFWLSLRGKVGTTIENEKDWWRDQKRLWKSDVLEQQAAKDALQAEADAIDVAMKDPKDPQMPDVLEGEQQPFGDLEKHADDVRAETDDVYKEVTGDPHDIKPLGELPKDYLDWEKTVSPNTRAALEGDEQLQRIFAQMDPEVRRMLTHCSDLCIPTKPRPKATDIKRIQDLLKRLGVSGDDPGLREYFYVRREALSDAITGVEDVQNTRELRTRLDEAIAKRADDLELKGVARRGANDYWEIVEDGRTVREFTLGDYGDLKTAERTKGYFQAHHGIQGEWGRERVPGYSYSKRGPAILLRDSRAGTPHQIITARQEGRAAGLASRTYSMERDLLLKDMEAADVPKAIADDLLARSDNYFAELYLELKKVMSPARLKDIFGMWKPVGT